MAYLLQYNAVTGTHDVIAFTGDEIGGEVPGSEAQTLEDVMTLGADTGDIAFTGDIGFFGVDAVSQQARPSTLNEAIEVLEAYGLVPAS